MSRPLLVLRPEPGNAATVARARLMGLDARAAPLFAVEPVAWSAEAADAYVGILLTSAYAVRHAGRRLENYLALPAYAVGEATAALARSAGFASVVAGDSDVARLMAHIATLGLHRLLHLSGEDVTPFDALGIEIDRHVVYCAVEIAPPPEFAAACQENPVILVHSQRAGKRLAALVAPGRRNGIAVVTISAAAALQAGQGWQQLAIAPEPRDEAMLKIAVELCRA